jgi:HemY protein
MRLALDDHNPIKARQSAKAALALKPNSVLAADHLFKLETRRNDWNAALPALDVMARQQKKTKSKTAPDQLALITRQRCALHFLKAGELLEGDRKSADKELLTALNIDPGFLPAVTMLADHYLDDKAYGRAAKIMEKAFKIHPHESIALRLKVAWKSNDGQFIAKLAKLVAQIESTQQKTAHYLVAKQARDAGLDGEAERLLNAARDLDGGEEEANSLWHCTSCKSRHDDWQAFCPACDEFATLVWQRPAGTSLLIKHDS